MSRLAEGRKIFSWRKGWKHANWNPEDVEEVERMKKLMQVAARYTALLVCVLALANCGGSEPAPSPKAAVRPSPIPNTPTPAPTPKPRDEALLERLVKEPLSARFKPAFIYKDDTFHAPAVMIDGQYLVSARSRFVDPEKAYYGYKLLDPKPSPIYSIMSFDAGHLINLEMVICKPGPRMALRGYRERGALDGLDGETNDENGDSSSTQSIAVEDSATTTSAIPTDPDAYKHFKLYEPITAIPARSIFTGDTFEATALYTDPIKRHLLPQPVIFLKSKEELEPGHSLLSEGERLLLVHDVKPMDDATRAEMENSGFDPPHDVDRIARCFELPAHLDYEEKWDTLVSHLSEDEVSKRYVPVFIFHNDNFHGCGTLVADGAATPTIIATCHQFAGWGTGYYAYQVLRPKEDQMRPIVSVRLSAIPSQDIVVCEGGTTPKKIQGLRFDTRARLAGKIDLSSEREYTSLLTGEKWKGYTFTDDELGTHSTHVAFFYKQLVGVGESGSGLERDDGRLLTLGSAMALTPEVVRGLEEDGVTPPEWADHLMLGALLPEADLRK